MVLEGYQDNKFMQTNQTKKKPLNFHSFTERISDTTISSQKSLSHRRQYAVVMILGVLKGD